MSADGPSPADATGPILPSEAARLFAPWRESEGLALAVSGGADSTALLVLAGEWYNDQSQGQFRPPRLVAFTVDHGLRAAAAAEAQQVGELAARLGIEHHVLRWRGEKPSANLQAAARSARYRLLAAAAARHGLDVIVTAHHLDDQAETLLLRLARGSGVYGLAAMHRESRIQGTRIARPFLDIPKNRLVATLEAAGISWISDPSNHDPRFARVRLRGLMPQLRQEGLTATRLAATARRLQRAAEAIDHVVTRELAEMVDLHPAGIAHVDAGRLVALPHEIGLRALARLLCAIGGRRYPPRLQGLESVHAELAGLVAGGGRMKRTLAGTVLTARGSNLSVLREVGRTGPPPLRLRPGESGLWDGRFRVWVPEGAVPLDIRCLGRRYFEIVPAAFRTALPGEAVAAAPGFFLDRELVAAPVLGLLPGHHRWRELGCQFIGGEALVPAAPDNRPQ